MQRLRVDLFLFTVFGNLYFVIETIYKGHITHWSMYIMGGIIGVSIGKINEYIPRETRFLLQCFYGMCIATLGEGISGLVLNVWLGLRIWDYSNMFGTFFMGQCCIPFCLIWFALSGVCILIDDYIRWKMFGEEKPSYTL